MICRATIGTQKQPRAKVTKPNKKPYQLRAHIFLGSDLPAGDEDALSDPYVVVSFGGAKGKTKVIEHTIYPEWYETIVLDVEVADANTPDIQFAVYDHDTVSSGNPSPSSLCISNLYKMNTWVGLLRRCQNPAQLILWPSLYGINCLCENKFRYIWQYYTTVIINLNCRDEVRS